MRTFEKFKMWLANLNKHLKIMRNQGFGSRF